jgi:activator of 2-hydroxyglutaryl-CoA dehydratase
VAGRALCEALGIAPLDDSVALAAAFGLLHPRVRSVVEMGMESQRFLSLAPDEVSGRLRIEDIAMGHKCAAGSGSFLEHMRRRLNYASIEEFALAAAETEPPATLSGRCSVFTESDIVHLYQKGTPRERIAAGIHQAICRNYRCAMVKTKEVVPQVAFVGGVSANPAVRKYLRQELGLEEDLFVPAEARASCPNSSIPNSAGDITLPMGPGYAVPLPSTPT